MITILILSEFKRINFYSPWNLQKTLGFLMISRETSLIQFDSIRTILEARYGDDPSLLRKNKHHLQFCSREDASPQGKCNIY